MFFVKLEIGIPIIYFKTHLFAIFQIDVPTSIEGSFYRGDVYIGLKDSILQPSSPMRHACELKEILKQRGGKMDRWVLLCPNQSYLSRNVTSPNMCIFNSSSYSSEMAGIPKHVLYHVQTKK